ncbi:MULTISPECIES: beta-lactamase family protein [unclassified Gordonia (in: high G+C Gram-positive bacteria)]|uniref:serine hydrolase domain-containing protein n=1 Tax=unclassified Gordonia (in: high G+C Gram-positive bacteria) TaxID=2657482 RepID=UPI001F0D902E|nr:beta-lactamase family protein [Gordonia sp. ABSL49_1]MCH5642355.1 beta-lactamase family protein [Gordonia sp. ABSL49_1]
MSTPTIDPKKVSTAVDEVVQAASTGDDRVPGVVAGVTTDTETIYLGRSGRRAIDDEQPMTDDTVFAIFSTTKAITGTAALQLVEDGQLDLQAPAREYVPAIGELQVIEGFDDDGSPRLRKPASDITTHHLLTHTAGFGYDFFNETYNRLATEQGQPSIIEATKTALRTPLLFDPGTKWEYGSNIDWAGQVVEAVSGQRLGAVMSDRIFSPLGMSNTSFDLYPDTDGRRARMHHRGEDGSLSPNHKWALPADPEVHMGGHGLYSTVGDYLKFMRMWLNDGMSDSGEQVLKPETVEMAERNHLGDLKVTALPGVIPALSNDAEFFPGMPKSWAYTFMINDEDAPTGRPAGALAWAGLANLYYWIDRRNKIGGYWATQILPFADAISVGRYLEFETAAYNALGAD